MSDIHNRSSYEIKPEGIQARMGFKPMNSAIPVQCSASWAISKLFGFWVKQEIETTYNHAFSTPLLAVVKSLLTTCVENWSYPRAVTGEIIWSITDTTTDSNDYTRTV